MAQTTRGLHAVLSVPAIYEAFQQAVGASRVRKEFVVRYFKPTPGLRVLDVGCGPGDLIEHLPGVAYTGTDLSAAYIASARRRFGHLGRFYVGRVEDLDSDGVGEFDVIIAKSLLHHTDEDEAMHLFDVASKLTPLRRVAAS